LYYNKKGSTVEARRINQQGNAEKSATFYLELFERGMKKERYLGLGRTINKG